MSFVQKTWVDRISEYPNRRTINDGVITKTGEDFTIEDNVGVVELTQADTLKLDETRLCEIQLSYRNADGKAKRTYITVVPASKILYNGEI